MIGTVVKFNSKGLAIVDFDSGQRATIEVISGNVENGDQLEGNFYNLGSQDIKNNSKAEAVHVFIEDHS